MRTLDRDNTWLRFTVQLVCYQFEGVDYLDAEVKGINEDEWHTVASLTNMDGSFERTTFEYNIAEELAGAADGRFQLRFRAHGDNAQYIDYWYVDDVKVWNPVWSSATLTVADDNGMVAGMDVTLTGDNGAVIQDFTDQQGVIDLSQIEVGTYTVTIVADGYNTYSAPFTVGLTPAHHDVRLTSPRIVASASSVVAADMTTESTLSQTLTLTNEGSGPAVWSLDRQLPMGKGQTDHRFELGPVFSLSGDLQTSIVFTGTHYYTSSWYFLGKFYKYDRDGRFLEEFSIPGMYYKCYDFAYDGQYVYASDYSNRIFQLDMDERRIVRVIDIPELPKLEITHLAYDPDRDGFWCGTFNTLVLVSRDGEQMAKEMTWEFDAYGSAYDNVTPGGPYLWVSDMAMPDNVIIDKIMLRQYSLNERRYTGVSHIVNDMPGYRNGSATNGQNQVCGVTVTEKLAPGCLMLVGVLQQSPSLVYSYKLCDFDQWLDVSPVSGTLQPGQSQAVTIGYNSVDAKVGSHEASELTLSSKPGLAPQHIAVSMDVTQMSATPRPSLLRATADVAQVTLNWQAMSRDAIGYRILRDGRAIATVPHAPYVDQGLFFGTYTYQVQALYEGGESLPTTAVSAVVRQGAPYYAPLNLEASISHNSEVQLRWQSPLTDQHQSHNLAWGTGQNQDQLGVGSGYFYAGHKWLAEELIPYRNKSITSVSVRICAPVSYLAARVYRDGKLAGRAVHSGKVAYGEYTTIPLARAIAIEPGSDYLVAVQVQSADGLRPLGMDEDTSFDGKGNLISLDGTQWYNASQSAIEGNFNLYFTVEPTTDAAPEAAPQAYRIYRDGEPVGTTTEPSFTDQLDTPGLHQYQVASLYEGDGMSRLSSSATVEVIDISRREAPAQVATVVERNRFVSLNWAPAPAANAADGGAGFPADLTAMRHTSRQDYPAYISSWPTQGTEMAVACDGRYVYTSIYNESGRINVYDLQGHYLGKTTVAGSGLGGIRNLAWDGESLWAADNSTSIHRLQVSVELRADGGYAISGSVVESRSISEYSRHLAYIPDLDGGRGGFETGDWNTSIFIDRQGAKVGNGPRYNAAAGTAYHGGRLYAFEQNNPLNQHCIAVYDVATLRQLMVIDLEQYPELTGIEEGSAGGASTFVTDDGITMLALCLQFGDRPSQVIILDVSGSLGVTGYNVYRNGQLVLADADVLHYQDTLLEIGQYQYQLSTCYIDGTESPLSTPYTIDIVEPGTASAPVCVQATPSAYPYNVNLSFADPLLMQGVAYAEDFEQGTIGQAYDGQLWLDLYGTWVYTDQHYYGQQGLMAAGGVEAQLILPVQEAGWMGFMARSEAEAGTAGVLDVYYTTGLPYPEDFVMLQRFATTDSWQSYDVALPAGTQFVLLRKPADCATAQYVDAFRLNAEAPDSQVYGYDIYRNGERINSDPVRAISYTDHNLAQGTYTYEVCLVSQLSAVSQPSQPAVIDLRYDNGGQAPVNVQAVVADDERSVSLTWQAPAIGRDVNLAWHNGHNRSAAGLPSGGAYWAGVRWSPSDLAGYDSLSITEVEVYINQVPEALYIMLYEGGELRRQQLVERPQQYAFNRIALREPLRLNTQKELRLVVYVEHNEITAPLGYDEGPCVANGKSNIYSGDGVTWLRLSDEDTGIDANWNFGIVLQPFALAEAEAARRARMRAADVVSATDESSLNALRGYKVYVNRQSLNDQPQSATFYVDEQVRPNVPYLEYQVKADYTKYGEVSSPIVRIANPMQHSLPDGVRGQETGIEHIGQDGQLIERYNLQGQRTDQPQGFTIREGQVSWE